MPRAKQVGQMPTMQSNMNEPDPPGVLLTIAKLVPRASDALPLDDFESRIEDYQRRAEAGLPMPLFGREGPPVPADKQLSAIICCACARVGRRKDLYGPRAWASRPMRCTSNVEQEVYCTRCFDIWGWPDELESIIECLEAIGEIYSREGERLANAGDASRREPVHHDSDRGASRRRKALAV